MPGRRLLLVVFLCTAAVPAAARSGRSHGSPGRFDYYVLSLSWSPQHCADTSGENEARQCGPGRRFGFVLHGLWPQYEHGFPEFCARDSRVPDSVVNATLPVMPSSQLIQHEWEKHGTCSGLDANTYFSTARHAFERIAIPAPYRDPQQAQRISPRKIEHDFQLANPTLSASAMAVLCDGRYLQEVRICLNRDLAPRRCGSDVSDRCRGGDVIVPPVR